jgi:hypothetical protein
MQGFLGATRTRLPGRRTRGKRERELRAQAAAQPAEAEGFSGVFRGLYSELGQVRDLVLATSCDLIRVFPVQ